MSKNLNINDLLSCAKVIQKSSTPIEILGLTSNSKLVKKNFLFIAEKGFSSDGHKYLGAAIDHGASALLVENAEAVPPHYQGLVLQANNTRELAAHLAHLFYGKPSQELYCIGITGTNGKTSLTYLVEHLFNASHRPTGVIGTINHHLGAHIWSTEMTTPHPIELQERLRQFCDGGAKTLAIEVSSHAIDQKRIEGIEFDVGLFTNLTRDHLDYHSTMEKYFEVKQNFLTKILPRSSKPTLTAIINRDDPWGQKIMPPSSVRTWGFGRSHTDFTFQIKSMGFQGVEFVLQSPAGQHLIQSPLIGIHNIYNVMAALATALAAGLSFEKVIENLKSFPGIPGRLQLVPSANGKTVLVDYAHSPDALENVLQSLQAVKRDGQQKGRIFCVFGCGGDRDKGKRPLMAQVAQSHSDICIVTSDNPRTEDPEQIIRDIQSGFDSTLTQPIHIECDRAKAIAWAIGEAKKEDVVLIAGKGHEDYQIIGKEKFYFSDFETARKYLL